jgi:hypothetical protein
MNDLQAFDPFLKRRPGFKNPKHGDCRLAFRRICGVCAHFKGNLKTKGNIPCAARSVETSSRVDAASCPLWTRKNAQGVKK